MRSEIFTRYFVALALVTACSSPKHRQAPAISFYYWKTKGSLGAVEQAALKKNDVPFLYVRYFDVDTDPAGGTPRPLSAIAMDSSFAATRIIPVVYIKNRVFEHADSNSITQLCHDVLNQVRNINEKNKIVMTEVQFDCDWTDKTTLHYFRFLEIFRLQSGLQLSATIRLHQVKYRQRTGIPPVDRGVLMFYNMGRIDDSPVNSIYDRSNAMKYVSSLKTYPLPLDIALPVFSWGIGIRGGKVQYLLNKMYPGDFEKDSNFVKMASNRFRAVRSFFKSGSYIRENDEIKVEAISEKDLLGMTGILNQNYSRSFGTLIFYDLDPGNLKQYDEAIFKKVSRGFR